MYNADKMQQTLIPRIYLGEINNNREHNEFNA